MDNYSEESFYKAPAGTTRCRFTVQGSRFIGTLAASATEEVCRRFLSELKQEFPDATHHAYAFRIGAGSGLVERSSDDGEPAGSAGAPMLQVLQGNNVSDAVVIATRYFGGTKLGIGGLTRAYRDCARLSLEEASLKRREPADYFMLELSYEDLGQLNRLIESLGGKIRSAEYTNSVTLKVKVPSRLGQNLTEGFESVCRGRGNWTRL